MAVLDKKISAFTTASSVPTPTTNVFIPIVDENEANNSNKNKKITFDTLVAAIPIPAGGMSLNEKINQNILFENVARLNYQDSLAAIAYRGGTFDIFTDETKIASKTQVSVSTLTLGADNGSVILGVETDSGVLDTGYTLNANDTVLTIYQAADGKIYVGGGFTTIGAGTQDRLARLNSDGTLDTGYTVNTNSTVSTIHQAVDGKIYVGGDFTTIGAGTQDRLARLNSDGTLDTGYTLNANGAVLTIYQAADGKIYVGGNFTTIGGNAKERLARLNSDGTLDTGYTLNANIHTTVETIYQAADGKIYVGGSFTTIGGSSKSCLARLNSDGTLDTGYTLNANTTVETIYQTPDEKIYVGGAFTTIGGNSKSYLARLNSDGTLDTGYTVNANTTVNHIQQAADGKIYVGGNFTTIGGSSKSYLASLNSDGTLDTGYTLNASYTVETIYQAADGKIYVGGDFTTIGGSSKDRLARLNAGVNFTTGNFISTSLDLTSDLAANPTKVVVSSTFATPTDTTLSLKISDGTPENDVTITSANFDTEVDCSSLTTRTLTLQWLFTTSDTAVTPTLNNYGVYFT